MTKIDENELYTGHISLLNTSVVLITAALIHHQSY